MNFKKSRERERERLSTLFYIKKTKRRSMHFDISLSSVPHFLSVLTSGKSTSMRSATKLWHTWLTTLQLCSSWYVGLDLFILRSKTVCSFQGRQRSFWLVVEWRAKKSSHPKNPILSPPSCCRHVVVECQYSHLTIKNYHWLLLVCSPKTNSRKPLASGFFLNFWHSHLYNQTPSSHRIHQTIDRVILFSTNRTTNLLVLYYSNIKNEFSE